MNTPQEQRRIERERRRRMKKNKAKSNPSIKLKETVMTPDIKGKRSPFSR